MNLIDEFAERASALGSLHYDEASDRLVSFLDWLQSQPLTKAILDDLRTRVNVDPLFGGHEHRGAPKAGSFEEIAAVGLRLIESSREHDFVNVCMGHGIEPPYNTSALQDYCADAVPRYIEPFVRYVASKLTLAASKHSIAGIAESTVSEIILSDLFQRDFPDTSADLQKISREFLRDDKDVAWQNVANSCRQALIDYCRELRSVYDIDLDPETKDADVKAILRQAIQALGATGQFGDSLEKLLLGVWSHTQSLLHRGLTTKQEATRLYLWTGLLIDELTTLFLQKISS